MLRELRAPQGRPLPLTGGTVIVGIGPGLLSAADDDNMIVIDCAGTLVLPSAADFTTPHEGPTLTPGETADIAVLRLTGTPHPADGAAAVPDMRLDILVAGGQVSVWNGRPLDALGATTVAAPEGVPGHDPVHSFLRTWVDDNDFVRQELLPDGRCDEARGNRPSAYRGRYRINGNRIDYLDDLGFWAFGEFRDGILHPAGYRFTRR
ncbi:Atu4866 domain-containing protein [Streptomyces sp. NPDC087917]|uniref:Atu4866 domain-containing protein n=1 Tax=Streptomyces sp. NPDC087917 TaxID=3155060 RepID=UPI003441ECF7